jgi:hypothetical protein
VLAEPTLPIGYGICSGRADVFRFVAVVFDSTQRRSRHSTCWVNAAIVDAAVVRSSRSGASALAQLRGGSLRHRGNLAVATEFIEQVLSGVPISPTSSGSTTPVATFAS